MSLTYTTTLEIANFYFDWGFVSSCLAEQFGVDSGVSRAQLARICPEGNRELIQPFTAMFVHADWTNGGWLHIAGNMLFLWVFGNNVEDRLGYVVFPLFYLMGGIAATALQIAFDANSTIPSLGASGAIGAILGAYAVLFPHARVTTLVIFFFITVVEIRAAFVLAAWFLFQVVSGVGQLGREVGGGVAYWAHIGGFAFGALVAWLLYRPRGRTPSIYDVPHRPDVT
jgi:membrane associated rhomboid family serine protease